MSDTPRTDAVSVELYSIFGARRVTVDDYEMVLGHARTLEREVAGLRDVLSRIRAWDALNSPDGDHSDARFWRAEIDKVLGPLHSADSTPR